MPATLLAGALSLLTVLTVLVVPAQAAPASVDPGAQIEGFAPYQGQTTCDPVVRAGVVAFRDLVLRTYPGTGDAGQVRDCAVGGASEHKEGRAWDWRVSAADPVQAAQVQDLVGWLFATDQHGNEAAMARRLGIMYVIWNRQVWKAYQSSRGWQPYSGSSPHTDHVHLSFGWAGAYGATSFWTGTVAPVMYAPVRAAAPAATATATTSTAIEEGVAPAFGDPRARAVQREVAVGSMAGPWRRR